MRSLVLLLALGVFASVGGAPGQAHAASPEAFCRSAGTDDTLRPIPQSLVPAAVTLFGLSAMPAEQVERGTFFRCYEGRVLVCNVGANLPCGKANTSRDLAGADTWCKGNPDSDFIPMYVTGHDTIYRWRCAAAKAEITDTVFKVDARGFIAELWKPASP